MRVAVIGAGISGLAAAYRLRELDPTAQVSVFESRPRPGGVLFTERDGGYLIEHSADMFSAAEPWAIGLCERIGFSHELINTDERFRRALVVKRGKLYPVPEGFALLQPRKAWPILTSRLLSAPTKARLLAEILVRPRRTHTDESLESFAVRRFGRGAFRWLIQPLVGGIYTADPSCLSMAATMDRFRRLEWEHGSLIRAGMKAQENKNQSRHENTASGARYGLFVAPRLGMSQLVEALVARLPSNNVHLGHRVTALARTGTFNWQITASCGQLSRTENYEGVVLATPAAAAAKLVEKSSDDLSRLLRSIPHASAAVAVLGYHREQIQHSLNAFGFVVPLAEGREILSTSFTSIKFAGRAPEKCVLFRVFIGGACQPELLLRGDEQLLVLATRELSQLLGINGSPHLAKLLRWREAMPQYHVGHLDRVDEIERLTAQIPGLALAGNAYRGVGIPYCIRSGEAAAESIYRNLKQKAL